MTKNKIINFFIFLAIFIFIYFGLSLYIDFESQRMENESKEQLVEIYNRLAYSGSLNNKLITKQI